MTSKVFTALAVSVDGYITGRDPGPGHGLGDGGTLFDWYGSDDPANRALFQTLANRVGATLSGRNTYDDSRWDEGGTPLADTPLIVLSHRPAPAQHPLQTFVSAGIEDAVAAARRLAGDKDVALMGGGVATEALRAGLVDELILHQVPVLLGEGRPYFQKLPAHVGLRLVEATPTSAVTHLHYAVIR